MEPRESFVFDKTIYEASKILPKSEQMKFLNAVVEYGLYGNSHEFEGEILLLFGIAKRLIDCQNEDGRSSSKYRNWKKSVLERDKYTCQKCGASGVQMNVHHIKSWKNYPEFRFDIKNGVCLCDECHKLFHKKKEK